MRHTTLALVPLLAALGCRHEARDDRDMPIAAADDDDDDDEIELPGDSGDDGGAESGESGDFEDKLDIPTAPEMSCQKIDFLFVIDDSGSMSDEQERLIDGFPGFIEKVEGAIAQYDYHMMVVTTAFDLEDAEEVVACDDAIGSGRTADGEGEDCGLSSEDAPQRYASSDEESLGDIEASGLADVFSCVADVGVTGSGFELPIWSMAQAITTHDLPGGCNEGFLRDDAILVVTIISDEEENKGMDSPGGPKLWKEVMVAAKHGDENAIVMLGLLGDTDLEDGQCEPYDPMQGTGAEGAPRLRKFVDSFEYGSWASVCQDDYAPFFNAAVADIGQACHEFVPPG